jgi:hypothetical protein
VPPEPPDESPPPKLDHDLEFDDDDDDFLGAGVVFVEGGAA